MPEVSYEPRDPGLANAIMAAANGDAPPAPVAPVASDESSMKRDAETPNEARAAQVTKLCQEVRGDKAHWEPRFKMAKRDTRFVLGHQWAGNINIYEEDRYIANITMRHVQQRVATLYAKNPTIAATRRQKLEYKLWDGKSQSLAEAQQTMMMAAQQGQPIDNMTMALIQDVASGMERKAMNDRIAKSLELVMGHYLKNQTVPFKRSMKKLVRRVITIGWGYLKIDWQREYETKPDVAAKIGAVQERLATIERILAELQDGKIEETTAEGEQLRVTLAQLEADKEVLVKEGLQISFPSAVAIIPDRKCKDLHGFLGGDRVSEEYRLTVDQIKEIYNVDVSSSYASYKGDTRLTHKTADVTRPDAGANPEDGSVQGECVVWDVYVPGDGVVYTICDGYPDYLQEPKCPNVKLDRFYPWFALTFNDAESDEEIFPLSDVTLMRPMQKQYNAARESLRRHRIAARPKTIVGTGMLTEEDKDKLKYHPANAVIELMGLQPGQKVEELLQAYKGSPIDQALYDTSFIFEDILRVSGEQEANLGGTGGATATEASIAENSRSSGLASNIDDLDDFLTEFARGGGQVLLAELSQDEATRIAGVGAVWPQMTRQEIADEIELEIVAGSSGRPNSDRKIANLERLAPLMLQVPGVKPEWLLRQFVNAIDDKVDLEDAFAEGLPSITTLNAIMQAAAAPAAGGVTPNGGGDSKTGDAGSDPAQQGPAGASNAPAPQAPGGLPMADGSAPDVYQAAGALTPGAAPI